MSMHAKLVIIYWSQLHNTNAKFEKWCLKDRIDDNYKLYCNTT